jgi:hypothetical protein
MSEEAWACGVILDRATRGSIPEGSSEGEILAFERIIRELRLRSLGEETEVVSLSGTEIAAVMRVHGEAVEALSEALTEFDPEGINGGLKRLVASFSVLCDTFGIPSEGE